MPNLNTMPAAERAQHESIIAALMDELGGDRSKVRQRIVDCLTRLRQEARETGQIDQRSPVAREIRSMRRTLAVLRDQQR